MTDEIKKVLGELEKEYLYSLKWDKDREERDADPIEFDKNKPVESWIVWMDTYLSRAKVDALKEDKTDSLDNIRKVANLAICCLAYRGCPSRDSDD
jgi:hypothetical protein